MLLLVALSSACTKLKGTQDSSLSSAGTGDTSGQAGQDGGNGGEAAGRASTPTGEGGSSGKAGASAAGGGAGAPSAGAGGKVVAGEGGGSGGQSGQALAGHAAGGGGMQAGAGAGGAGGGTPVAGDGGAAGHCNNQCAAGDERCNGDSQVQGCILVNGCYTWGSLKTCGARQRCTGNAPNAQCTCSNPPASCDQGAGSSCQDNVTLVTCAADSDGCLYEQGKVSCPTGMPCSGAHPDATCSCASPPAECSGVVGNVCRSSSAVVTCARNASGCLAVSGTKSCTAGKPCAGAPGAADCKCPAAPAACVDVTDGNVCQSNTSYVTCSTSADGCVTAATKSCNAAKPCRGGAGSAACICINEPTASDCPAASKNGSRCVGSVLYTCGSNTESCGTITKTTCPSGGACVDDYPNARCIDASEIGVCFGKPSGTCSIGSDATNDTAGYTGYAKAQSFKAPDSKISRVDIYVPQAISKAWELRIVSALPAKDPAVDRGVVLTSDLNAKTLGTAKLNSSAAGWVTLTFNPAVKVSANATYYIFVPGDPSADPGTGPRNWSQSTPGAFPGPYADGTAYVLVYSWSDNNNYNDSMQQHSDYAFKVWP